MFRGSFQGTAGQSAVGLGRCPGSQVPGPRHHDCHGHGDRRPVIPIQVRLGLHCHSDMESLPSRPGQARVTVASRPSRRAQLRVLHRQTVARSNWPVRVSGVATCGPECGPGPGGLSGWTGGRLRRLLPVPHEPPGPGGLPVSGSDNIVPVTCNELDGRPPGPCYGRWPGPPPWLSKPGLSACTSARDSISESDLYSPAASAAGPAAGTT